MYLRFLSSAIFVRLPLSVHDTKFHIITLYEGIANYCLFKITTFSYAFKRQMLM